MPSGKVREPAGEEARQGPGSTDGEVLGGLEPGAGGGVGGSGGVPGVVADRFSGGAFEQDIEVTDAEYARLTKVPVGTVEDLMASPQHELTGHHLEDATQMMIRTVGIGNQPAHYTNFLWLLLRAHGVVAPEMVVLEELEGRLRNIEQQIHFQRQQPNIRQRTAVMADLDPSNGQRRRP